VVVVVLLLLQLGLRRLDDLDMVVVLLVLLGQLHWHWHHLHLLLVVVMLLRGLLVHDLIVVHQLLLLVMLLPRLLVHEMVMVDLLLHFLLLVQNDGGHGGEDALDAVGGLLDGALGRVRRAAAGRGAGRAAAGTGAAGAARAGAAAVRGRVGALGGSSVRALLLVLLQVLGSLLVDELEKMLLASLDWVMAMLLLLDVVGVLLYNDRLNGSTIKVLLMLAVSHGGSGNELLSLDLLCLLLLGVGRREHTERDRNSGVEIQFG
jgi:hypothetical protein